MGYGGIMDRITTEPGQRSNRNELYEHAEMWHKPEKG
jgi:hypothetical protein